MDPRFEKLAHKFPDLVLRALSGDPVAAGKLIFIGGAAFLSYIFRRNR